MKVLELFAGTRSIGKAFEERGHEVFSIEWDKRFEGISLYKDVLQVTPAEILEKFGKPDVIWASPDCTTYSIAAISHHRRKDAGGQLIARLKLCQVLRPGKPTRSWPNNGLVPDRVVHRKSEGWDAENRFHVSPPQVYRDLLPVWRQPDEANRHLDQSPGSEVQTALPQRRPLPCERPQRGKDWDAGAGGECRTIRDTAGAVQAYRGHLRRAAIQDGLIGG